MRALVVEAPNKKWQLQDLPKPVPGPGQVLIRIHASGFCFTDIHQTHGSLPGPFPRTLGHEPVGTIEEVGPGVTIRKVGDRVGVPWAQGGCERCEWCLKGKQLFCANLIGTAASMSGGHADYMLAYAQAAMLLPEKLSFEQAAPIFCAGYTVYSGLKIAKPQPGDRVAVQGIGGLGHLAIQYAKASGFETIAISRSPDKDALIKSLGADHIVRDGAELDKKGGADVILATSNSSEAAVDAMNGLRPDGAFVVMGFDPEPMKISAGLMIMKRLRLLGSQQNNKEDLYEALQIAAAGKVKVITEAYKFEDVEKVYDRVERGQVRFRAVFINN